MTWKKTPEDRRNDAKNYGPEYKRNRAVVLRQAGGRCAECGRRDRRIQVDHITPVSQGGGHAVENLRALCSGPGSCHARKTAQEGGGYRKNGGTRAPADPQCTPRTAW